VIDFLNTVALVIGWIILGSLGLVCVLAWLAVVFSPKPPQRFKF
jgi:hypothetical protein